MNDGNPNYDSITWFAIWLIAASPFALIAMYIFERMTR